MQRREAPFVATMVDGMGLVIYSTGVPERVHFTEF
jgi:hypothetical protein